MLTPSIAALAAVVQEHGQEAAAHGAEAAGHGEEDIGTTLMHHLTDAPELELPWGVVHLPHFEPLQLGPLTLDLSPTKHVVFLFLAAIVCTVVFVTLGRIARKKTGEDAPSGFANAMEAMVLYFRDEVARRNIGHGADKFTPLILTLFFFILTMNLLGLVPWGATATGNLSVTFALAVVSFFAIELGGFLELGPRGYAKTIFYAPPGLHPVGQALMLVIMTPVEFLGKLAKPFALMIRLFANMTAGHTVILALLGLIIVFGGNLGVAGGSVVMSSLMMVLEVFIAFLQAYIFAMLTAVFIGLIRHAH